TASGGFSLPSTVRAGYVTFNVSTPESSSYHGFQGFRLNPGVNASAATVLDDFWLSVTSKTPTGAVIGSRGLLQHATLIGGVVASSFAPISLTVPLEPGTYYFFDLGDFFRGMVPELHTLQAVGSGHWSGLPQFSQTILTATNQFVAPTNQSAMGT